MKKYRIRETFYRQDSTAEVYSIYYIEHKKKTLTGLKWKPYKLLKCYGMDCYKEQVSFNSEKEAEEYIRNLKNPIKESRIIRVI